jgi:glycosyltransferase involved in cell wall biosynthesis
MRASILIGAHNEGSRLWRTLDSILESSDKLDAEIIVADDGSTDGLMRSSRNTSSRSGCLP